MSAFTAALACSAGGARAAAAVCAHADGAAVVAVVERLLVELGEGDAQGLQTTVTPDFEAYDGGRRFNRDELLRAVETAKRAGKRFRWSVTAPVVHLSCRLAWMAYVNRGEVVTGEKAEPAVWLESVVLRYERRRWRIAFLHSSRAAED